MSVQFPHQARAVREAAIATQGGSQQAPVLLVAQLIDLLGEGVYIGNLPFCFMQCLR